MPPRSTQISAHGFTLLELVISVALVLVLMLAITRIFSITSTTVGASQAFAAATRDARAAQTVFAHDISSMASDSPFIWIRYNDPVPAFRNRADELGDRDYVTSDAAVAQTATQKNRILTIDIDGNGIEGEGDGTVPGESVMTTTPLTTSTLAINGRSHRQDRFSFCARDRFSRQTGNTPNMLIAPMSSPEAWVTYGHLTLPFTNGSFKLKGDSTSSLPTNPGAGTAQTNSQNFYASQWVLGRVAMLMVAPPSTGAIKDTGGVDQQYYDAGSGMTPFANGTTANVSFNAKPINLNEARYDLVATDISNGQKLISDYIKAENPTPWYQNMLASPFQIDPFVIKPVDARTASQQVPIFMQACSQFVVEFAGDFVSQNANGSLNALTAMGGLEADGQIDFHYDKVTGTRQIQWFGYPRSAGGNLSVNIASGDTCLVGDFVHYISGAGATPVKTSAFSKYGDFMILNPDFASFEQFGGGSKATYKFVDGYSAPIDTLYMVWNPESINNPVNPRPKMYRITLTIDRPEMAGRTADGQTFEYVFNAP